MPDLQGFKQFVIQQYPNISKTQLDQLDSFIGEEETRQIAEQGVPLGQIQTDPTLRRIQFEQSQRENFAYTPEPKEPTDTQITKRNLGRTGLSALKSVRTFYDEDPNIINKQLIPGKFESRSFDSALFGAVDTLLRIRTGAAAPPSEVRNYMRAYGPAFGDKPKDIDFKINLLKYALISEGGLTQAEANDLFEGKPPFESTKDKAAIDVAELQAQAGFQQVEPGAMENIQFESTPEEQIATQAVEPQTEPSLVESALQTFKKPLEVGIPGLQLFNPESRKRLEGVVDLFLGKTKVYAEERFERAQTAQEKKDIGEQMLSAIETAVPLIQMVNVRGEEGEGILDDEATGAAIELGLYLLTPKILEKAGKLFSPFKTLGEQRSAAAKATKEIIDGNEFLTKLAKHRKTISASDIGAFDDAYKIAQNLYKGGKLTIEEAIELAHNVSNKAYTATGAVRTSGQAAYNEAAADVLRKMFRTQTPEISIMNQKFERLYDLKGLAKRFIFPAALGAGISFPISRAIGSLYGRGQGGPSE